MKTEEKEIKCCAGVWLVKYNRESSSEKRRVCCYFPYSQIKNSTLHSIGSCPLNDEEENKNIWICCCWKEWSGGPKVAREVEIRTHLRANFTHKCRRNSDWGWAEIQIRIVSRLHKGGKLLTCFERRRKHWPGLCGDTPWTPQIE